MIFSDMFGHGLKITKQSQQDSLPFPEKTKTHITSVNLTRESGCFVEV